jgi:hypothetical protein
MAVTGWEGRRSLQWRLPRAAGYSVAAAGGAVDVPPDCQAAASFETHAPQPQKQQQAHQQQDGQQAWTDQQQPLCCTADVLGALPPHLLARLQQPGAAASPGAVLAELRASLGPALRTLPLPRRARRAPPPREAWRERGAWQVPSLPGGWPDCSRTWQAPGQQQQQQQQQHQTLLLLSSLAAPAAGAPSSALADGGRFHLEVLRQLDAVGWGRVAALGPDLSRVAIQLEDEAGERQAG